MDEAEDQGSLRLSCPSELVGPLPRKTKLSSTNGWYGVIVGSVLLGLGSVLCGYLCIDASIQMQHRAVLRRDGRDIVGRVSMTHGGHGDSTVSYTFPLNGVTYFGKAQLPDYYLVLHESDQIAVRYLPSNPDINHPAEWEWSGLTGVVAKVFVLFFMAMGGVAFALLSRERKLAREGKVAEGVVTDCVQEKNQFRVEYEFHTEDGVLIKGNDDFENAYGAGARIWILYLPQKPKRNHSYPLSYYEVVE